MTDRMPFPLIQMSPQDMADLKLKAGDLVEIYNDNGSTQAMVYPTTTARRKETFMLFANPTACKATSSRRGSTNWSSPTTSRPGPRSVSCRMHRGV